jgi:hypothetical protein
MRRGGSFEKRMGWSVQRCGQAAGTPVVWNP